MKYKSIIERMTAERKTAVLTDPSCLADAELMRIGMPAVRGETLKERSAQSGLFPDYESAACSWDVSLIGKMSEALALRARREGINLLYTPDLKCAASPYAAGLSEDACLNGEIGAAAARAVHAAGAACALSLFAVKEEDVALLDVRADARAVYELFYRPFLLAAEAEPCEAAAGALTRPCAGYTDVNEKLFAHAGCGRDDVFLFAERTDPSVDFHSYFAGGACIGGAGVALDRAIGRYTMLEERCREGSATERELQGALDDGSAIPPQAVDEAVDKAVDLAFRVNSRVPASSLTEPAGEIAAALARESVVLLKNRGALPLSPRKKAALFGDVPAGFAQALSPVLVTGESADAEEGARLAKGADVLILFLSPQEGSLHPSAEQDALLQALARTGRQMIAVLPASRPADLSFDGCCAATVLAPVGGGGCAAALADVLTGRAQPCGRLARTFYDGADALFGALREDKDKGRTRVADFVGYRYYDTAGHKVRYPFGFGLSYTRFAYSGLRLGEEEVSFTVKNIGGYAGWEVPQVYVGGISLAGVYPKKKLAAFTRVYLEKGEERQVTLPLPRERFATFDGAAFSAGVEEGDYAVYVCSSVSDVRLRGVVSLAGEKRRKGEDRPADYFRDLADVGKADGLDSAAGKTRPAKNKPLRATGFWLTVAALLAAVIAFPALAGGGISLSEGIGLGVCLFVAAVGGLLLLIEKRRRAKLLAAEKLAQELRFSDGITGISIPEEVFAEAMRPARQEGAGVAGGPDEPKFFDPAQTFASIGADLQKFASERGVFLSGGDLSSLLACLASARLVIAPGGAEKEWNAFASILAAYCGTELFAENADACSPFFVLGKPQEGGILDKAAAAAEKAKPLLHIVLLRHAGVQSLAELEPLCNFLPGGAENADDGFPQNLRVIALAEEGEGFSFLPQGVAEGAAFCAPAFTESGESAEKTAVKPLGYYQFAHLCRRVRDDYPLEERLWKRADKLEERAGEGFRFGNRLWIKAEMHVSVCLACGIAPTDALDSAVAGEMLVCVEDRLCGEEEGDGTAALAEIFGSEEISFCRRIAACCKEKENNRTGRDDK